MCAIIIFLFKIATITIDYTCQITVIKDSVPPGVRGWEWQFGASVVWTEAAAGLPPISSCPSSSVPTLVTNVKFTLTYRQFETFLPFKSSLC